MGYRKVFQWTTRLILLGILPTALFSGASAAQGKWNQKTLVLELPLGQELCAEAVYVSKIAEPQATGRYLWYSKDLAGTKQFAIEIKQGRNKIDVCFVGPSEISALGIYVGKLTLAGRQRSSIGPPLSIVAKVVKPFVRARDTKLEFLVPEGWSRISFEIDDSPSTTLFAPGSTADLNGEGGLIPPDATINILDKNGSFDVVTFVRGSSWHREYKSQTFLSINGRSAVRLDDSEASVAHYPPVIYLIDLNDQLAEVGIGFGGLYAEDELIGSINIESAGEEE